jgi:hypothetical protein
MELLKDKKFETYEHNGVKFTFRTNVTVGDKFEFDTSGTISDGDKISFRPWDLYKALIRIFMVSWEGVTKDGQPIEWNYDVFIDSFPSESGTDLIMNLGKFIGDKTGIFKTILDERKNG